MAGEKKGLGIIFHSGSYDRLHHGFSIALAALALGRPVRFFFSYWALEYLKRGMQDHFRLDGEASEHRPVMQKGMERGHLEPIPEIIGQIKAMGGRFYTCTHSMGLLNIARDELIEAVDRSMGLTAFLTETAEDQILFI
jgi:peroxiredoxin family protein